ncbi:MAG: ankyrin repeat domain-containing protein [Acidimicrobiia bacterium]
METEVSAVREALYRGDRAGAEALIVRGVPLNVFDEAASGRVEPLRAMLVEDPSLAAAWSADGFTALHFAAYLGGAEVVEVLLAAGADVRAVSRNDMRVEPLHSSAALGDVDGCRMLLDAGADPNATQQGGWTPLDEALITRNEALTVLLRDRGARVSGNSLSD